MKKWSNPELQNLNIQNTNTDETCPGTSSLAKQKTIIPIDDGNWWNGIHCIYKKDGHCTNPKWNTFEQITIWGVTINRWPCPKAVVTPPEIVS